MINAKITGTKLGYEDHGVLTCWIFLDYGGMCQGFGGYCLDNYNQETQKRKHSEMFGITIEAILKVCGVDNWEDLPGKYVRVHTDRHCGSTASGISHILDDKISFVPKEIYTALDLRNENRLNET